jgi:hypothetical protein
MYSDKKQEKRRERIFRYLFPAEVIAISLGTYLWFVISLNLTLYFLFCHSTNESKYKANFFAFVSFLDRTNLLPTVPPTPPWDIFLSSHFSCTQESRLGWWFCVFCGVLYSCEYWRFTPQDAVLFLLRVSKNGTYKMGLSAIFFRDFCQKALPHYILIFLCRYQEMYYYFIHLLSSIYIMPLFLLLISPSAFALPVLCF